MTRFVVTSLLFLLISTIIFTFNYKISFICLGCSIILACISFMYYNR